jgi:hypothetical protein
VKLHCENGCHPPFKTERFERQPHETNCPECGGRLLTGMERNAKKRGGSSLRAEPEPPVIAEAHTTFSQLVTEWPCFLKDTIDGKRRRPDHECWGPVDPHHAVPASWIRGNYSDLADDELAKLLYAPIIGIPLCRRGHQEVEDTNERIYWEELDRELILWVEGIDAKYPDRPSMLTRLQLESPSRQNEGAALTGSDHTRSQA